MFEESCAIREGPARRGPWAGPDRRGRPSTLLLVEPRDEVFARLAADLAEAGLRVVRAESAAGAIERLAIDAPCIVVVSRDAGEQSGWLVAAKLRLSQPAARIWVYLARKTAVEVSMARFLRVEELVAYHGDLFRLSDAILDCLAGCPVSSEPRPWARGAVGANSAA